MFKRKFDDLIDEKPCQPDSTSNINEELIQLSDSDSDDDKSVKIIKVGGKDILDLVDLEGEEDGVVGNEGQVPITPFNMREELEEGEFDSEGMFHWRKEEDAIPDNWLDNIDWIQVKNDKSKPAAADPSDEMDSLLKELQTAEEEPFDSIKTYTKILSYMLPHETIAASLRRIAGKRNMSSAEKWKRKKAGVELSASEQQAKQDIADLTHLANLILQKNGNMSIYQESFEAIQLKVNKARKSKQSSLPATIPSTPALDMYEDNFDAEEKQRLGNVAQTSQEVLPQDKN